MISIKLFQKLNHRAQDGTLRSLDLLPYDIDFFSNDYLGFASNKTLKNNIQTHFQNVDSLNGSSGSRLISGNHPDVIALEQFIANYHQSEGALLYQSGYAANTGFLGCVPQKNDLVLCDELVHASIKEGLKLSYATTYKFRHLDSEDLAQKIQKFKADFDDIYVITESVFSMDGDSPNFTELIAICKKHHAYLVVDEAHALGLYQTGLLQTLQLHQAVFARIFTFGKALGVHGAAVVGSQKLIEYLINFSRSFIYTTAPNAHQVSSISEAYVLLKTSENEIQKLKDNINFFVSEAAKYQKIKLIPSTSAIQCVLIEDVIKVKKIAQALQDKGFGIKPILSPTVPLGKERMRVCLHSYNTHEDIKKLIYCLSELL